MIKKEKLLRREGFWFSEEEPNLPMPIGVPWSRREHFLSALGDLESMLGNDAATHYKGFSRCRMCGQSNGSKEYVYEGWRWPSGFRHYIVAHGVRPSLAFEEFILDREVPTRREGSN